MKIKLLLLDRDGVLNKNRADYVKNLKELEIFPEAVEAISRLQAAGLSIVLVTNQSCIGRNIITKAQLSRIHDAVIANTTARGGSIDKIYFAPDAPNEATIFRKPNPGMMVAAMEYFQVSAEETALVGDSLVDMEASARAGITQRILVKTGHGKKTLNDPELDYCRPSYVASDILDAINFILKNQR